MKELIKKPSFWITLVIVIVIISYASYLGYNYSKCKKDKDSPCNKSTSRSGSTMRGDSSNILPLTDAEKATMNSLADKANSGAGLTNSEWSTLNKLVYRNIKNGGADPVIRSTKPNDGKIKCSFFTGKSCE